MVQKKLQHANDLVEREYICVVCKETHTKTFTKAKAKNPPIAEIEYCKCCKSDRFFRLK